MAFVCYTFSMDTSTFETQLATFVIDIQKNVNSHFEKNFPRLTAPTILVEHGKKYTKIIKQDVGSAGRSVFCFVERETGNVLKAESWKRPAKGVRGNISSPAENSCTVYGARYL